MTPSPKIEKLDLNKILGEANDILTEYMNKIPEVHEKLIHIINTIMKIPEMYKDDIYNTELQSEVIKIFTEVATSPSFPSDDEHKYTSMAEQQDKLKQFIEHTRSKTSMIEQQHKLEQLIDRTRDKINDELLKGVTNKLDIQPNKGGWGPEIPTPSGPRPPTDLEKIMDVNNLSYEMDINNRYNETLDKIIKINTTELDNTIVNKIGDMITFVSDEILKLIFGYSVDRDKNPINDQGYGETTAYAKIFVLLVWNNYVQNYPVALTTKILANLRLLDKNIFRQIINGSRSNPIYASNPGDFTIFSRDIPDIIEELDASATRHNIDIFTSLDGEIFRTATDPSMNQYSQCITNGLRGLFSNSDNTDIIPINLYNGDLKNKKLADLVKYPIFARVRKSLNNLPNLKGKSWFDAFSEIIIKIYPLGNTRDDSGVFYNKNQTNIRMPRTPLPFNGNTDPKSRQLNNDMKYTFLELFRIFAMLDNYLLTTGFSSDIFPLILAKYFPNWLEYVDTIGNKQYQNDKDRFIGILFPEYIFLYKILVIYAFSQIETVITNCIKNLIVAAIDTVSPLTVRLIKYYVIANDFTVLNLLLPSNPNFSKIISNDKLLSEISTEPYATLASRRWNTNTPLYTIYSNFNSNVSDDLLEDITDGIANLIDNESNMDWTFFDELRRIIELIVARHNDEIMRIIQKGKVTYKVTNRRDGETIQSDQEEKFTAPIIRYLFNGIRPIYNETLSEIDITETYEDNLNKLVNKEMTETFFLTETYGFFLSFIKKKLERFEYITGTVSNVMADIIVFINNKTYYYIPQIFLPALVKQIIRIINELTDLNKIVTIINSQKVEFYPLINMSNPKHKKIIGMGNNILKQISDNLANFYKSGPLKIVEYHNNIVDFLNTHSSYQLINSDKSSRKKFFSGILTSLPIFSDEIALGTNLQILQENISAYVIPEIIYYTDPNEFNDVNTQVFGDTDQQLLPNIYMSSKYRDIISYARNSNAISDLPIRGKNYQLNIYKNVVTNDFHDVDEIHPIAGQWLDIDLNNLDEISYANASIGYTINDYPYNELNGMPPAIKSFIGPYIKNIKLIIIENIIQYVIDQHAEPSGHGEKKIVDLYNKLSVLANENTYIDVSNVKIYVIIGQLADAIINRLLEYSTRQCITSWIYSFASTNPNFKSIVDSIKNTVAIINSKDTQKLSLNDINKDDIENLAKSDDRYLDFSLTQIEPNPKELSYTTSPAKTEFIHYLYNMNYYSNSNTNTNKKCFYIYPEIADKLINDKTLNAKNSDGKTPLHYAVEIGHPGLINLLILKGANPKGFLNIKGQSAHDIAIQNIKELLKYTVGNYPNSTVDDTIENFAVPFNDLLVTRLKEDKFGNNIIKNITLAIPIQIIMYNHMFRVYLENYRYGFSAELKKSFKSVVGKRYNYYNNIYPVDLFEIDSEQELRNITQRNDKDSRIKNIINDTNKKKINSIEKRITQLKIQLDGLAQEKRNPSDAEQIKFIDDISNSLNAKIKKYEEDLEKISVKNQPEPDKVSMQIYLDMVNSISSSVIDRSYGIIQFYEYGFSRLARNKDFYTAVWNNYIHKKLKNAPSMIFSVTADTILHLINELAIKGNAAAASATKESDIKNDLDTIVDFLKVVSDYIESKDPSNLDPEENPINVEQCEQVIYLINLILTPAIRNILLSQIYLGITEMVTQDPPITEDRTAILNEILTTEFNGVTLNGFLENILPMKVYKYFTLTYVNDYDPDRKITNDTDIFEPIIEFVKQFRMIQITDESVIVKNIRDYLIPYMINTYQYFIHHLRLTVYGYEKYLLNVYQNAKVLQILMQHNSTQKYAEK